MHLLSEANGQAARVLPEDDNVKGKTMPRDTNTTPNFNITLNDPIFGKGTVTAYTGTAGNTAVLPIDCNAVYVWCTTDAHVKVGVSATATTADMALPASTPMVLPVHLAGSRVSAIQVSSGGNLMCMPLYK